MERVCVAKPRLYPNHNAVGDSKSYFLESIEDIHPFLLLYYLRCSLTLCFMLSICHVLCFAIFMAFSSWGLA